MTARPRLQLRRRTDWFRILADLANHGQPNLSVAAILSIPLGTVRGWKAGQEPAHYAGQRLLELWSSITGQLIEDRPMVED